MTELTLTTSKELCKSASPETNPPLPLVILHGLFGSRDNWGARAKVYSNWTTVHCMDLRNHGTSPQSDTMSYPVMAADVVHTLDDLGIDQCDLLGHSMGGKVAMQIAASDPHRLKRLIVVDIAPRDYPPHHEAILNTLSEIDTTTLERRKEADLHLATVEKDPVVRAFLLKSLIRISRDGTTPDSDRGLQGYRWEFNLPALKENYQELMRAPELSGVFPNATLFIKGENSDYLQDSDKNLVLDHFLNPSLKIIPDSGHWPHAENPRLFDTVLGRFLGYS